jgi:protoheme IX farnesyltransferase
LRLQLSNFCKGIINLKSEIRTRPSIRDYVAVLKPRETSLLVFIGACSALVAASTINGAFPAISFVLTIIAITMGSAGANGLTNYLDRDVDARMQRTCRRPLAAARIRPPEKALPMIIILLIAGLVLAWILAPICFVIGLIGIMSSGIFRKTISCTFLGIIAGSAPVLIGWYAITKYTEFAMAPLIYFCMIALWTPLHVWTLMLSNRSDYENAGLRYFPLSWEDKKVIRLLAILSVALAAVAVLNYFVVTGFHWLYLSVAIVLSVLMVAANLNLMRSPTSNNSWVVYKLSAFPYLGIIFAAMVLDVWLL